MFSRLKITLLLLVLTFGIVGCGNSNNNAEEPINEPSQNVEQNNDQEAEQAKYEDGIYYAEADGFVNDWKYTVTIEVKNGEIISAEWNGANINGGKDKVTLSTDGEYPMVEAGAQSEWYEQAELVEEYLLETQDPTDINYNDEGETDDIAGVSIGVDDFFILAEKALNDGQVAQGDYKDGFYYAQEDEFDEGFKSFVHIAVKNGSIVGVDFNGIPEEEDADDKYHHSLSGDYGMVEHSDAQSEWHEQAKLAAEYLIETQDPTKIEYINEDGQTDDIAGVSIKIKDYFKLAEKALADAK